MNHQASILQTIESVSNLENATVEQEIKKSSQIFDKIAFKKNQINKEQLQQQLIQNRQIYLEQKQQDIADQKQLRKLEKIKIRAEQSQGLIQHPKQFRQIFQPSDLFSPTKFVQPEQELKEINKFTFVPLKQKIQQSIADKKISQAPWISASNGQDAFDKNQIFKPTPQEEKLVIDQKEKFKQQRFDYKNFKNYLKTKFNNLYFEYPQNQNEGTTDNKPIKQKSSHQSQEYKNELVGRLQPQIQRSNTASSVNRIKKPNDDTQQKELRAQSTERERAIHKNNKNQNALIQNNGRDSPKLVFKRIQSPQNISLNFNSIFFNNMDQEQINSKNHKLISMNIPQKQNSTLVQNINIKQRIPLQKLNSQFQNNLNSPINRVCSPQNTFNQQFSKTGFMYSQQNSPMNQVNFFNSQQLGLQKTTSSVSTHENAFHSRKQSHSLFNSTLQSLNQKQQSQQSSLAWKYGYSNNHKTNEIFSQYTSDSNDFKMNQSRSPNFVFKPNGNLGNLFSDYYKDKGENNETKQNKIIRDRVASTSSSKKQLTSS
ncbi:hypothetical protein TTHERM_00621000 (macronuclear) [Tetrahymena thermophila SB210]|uniref:Uncharacterized protein n=1 Tax=Tetrahymena thermophila (strain SB210) TaxID=312017 RepID=Q23MF9_TETTS|nr:hypothetical protein TTHERM_00621000 [Tetrahymena thermophila SB210]EAR97680.2 hypothetical protein TTHERM_00621000 [Tetrahymena thermophila SB210]|eukprot:XP_001017925.2 hypothetical protein TTHERM_00621000 [Tetrahymena thermophila SB210]